MAIAGERIYYPIVAQPGLKRDGTRQEGTFSTDAQHARIQRGLWRKMGGYRTITESANWPIRGVYVHTEDGNNRIYLGSSSRLQFIDITAEGVGGGILGRTPVGFIADDRNIWQMDGFPNGGGNDIVLMAHAAPNLLEIDSSIARKVYFGSALSNAQLIDTGAPEVSGGICVSPPYCFAYGSDGFVAWCNANEPATWTPLPSNSAGSARIARQKIVKGLAARNGRAGPGAIFWALDAVIVAQFSGTTTIFDFQTASGQSSILSSQSVIEYDSIYYWIGIDRFLIFNGVVQELQNNVSINWFFDNLNWKYRNKVWATKIPRYGEIWWHFPYGDSEECNAAIIFNIRENCWYDTRIDRTSGYFAQVLRFPVWAGAERSGTELIRALQGTPLASEGIASNAFDNNFATACTQTMVNGYIAYDYGVNVTRNIRQVRIRSAVLATMVVTIEYSDDLLTWYPALELSAPLMYSPDQDVILNFLDVGAHRAWRLRGTNVGFVPTGLNISELYFMEYGAQIFIHEKGNDAVIGSQVFSISSYFETPVISFTREGPANSGWSGVNSNVQIEGIEPDFIQSGEMNVTVRRQRYPNSAIEDVISLPFSNSLEKLDIKAECPLMTLKFESNVIGGDFQAGQILLELTPFSGRR